MTATPYENIHPKQQSCSLFSKCCFCIPLETGCFILGYISLVLNFIITIIFVLTIAFLAIFTHGFRDINRKDYMNGDMDVITTDTHVGPAIDRTSMNFTIIIIGLVGCLNMAWFTMNIVLLVGLHKKRPGHIKLHVTVATIRLLLSIIGVTLFGPHTTKLMLFCSLEIAFSAYFILLYYTYAIQLEREQRSVEIKPVSDIIADAIFSYPRNLDKMTLTEKDEKFETV